MTFKCFDCGIKKLNSDESYSCMENGKYVSSCRGCVNSLRKWHGFLNHIWCGCFDDGVVLP